jgi:hypothetical protein
MNHNFLYYKYQTVLFGLNNSKFNFLLTRNDFLWNRRACNKFDLYTNTFKFTVGFEVSVVKVMFEEFCINSPNFPEIQFLQMFEQNCHGRCVNIKQNCSLLFPD